jgi:WD40 repeat protein
MAPIVSFLEDQSAAIATWRFPGHSKPLTLAATGSTLHLMSDDLEIIQSLSVGSSRINRLVGLSGHASVYFSCIDGSMGLVTTSGSRLGKVEQSASPSAENGAIAVDSDIHRSGHLASILFNTSAGGSFGLVDMQRDAVMGRIPLGQTGTPNAVRIVDNSSVCVASSVVSLFDVRKAEAKTGTASSVFLTASQEASGRVFTALESDGVQKLIAGDSSGGIWLWDTRKPDSPIKSVHAHAGGVLTISLGGGMVGSSAADGSVSLWTVLASEEAHAKKKSRRILLDDSAGPLKRCAVEGSGIATALCVEDGHMADSERCVSYVTDVGTVVLASTSDWQ